MKNKAVLPLMVGVGLMLSACGGFVSPTVQNHGFVDKDNRTENIRAGTSTKADVQQLLGSPSTISSFGPEVWYYISSTSEELTWHKKKITDRNVVAVHFNEANVVEEVKHYATEDGQDVALVGRKTETRGKKLGFLEQLFGNVGRFNKVPGTDDANPF